MCVSLSSSFSLYQGEVLPATFSPPHLLFFSTLLCFLSSSSSLPPLLSSSHLSLIFIQSSHLSLGLPRLLLPCSRNSVALFGSRSSAILSTCPAHCNLLLISLSVKLLYTPVSSLNSTILRVSALVTLAIFRTQLFSHTCSLCCSSVRAKVSVTYMRASVTPARCPTLPSGGLCVALQSFLGSNGRRVEHRRPPGEDHKTFVPSNNQPRTELVHYNNVEALSYRCM